MGIGLPHTHDAHALLIRPRSPVNRSERRRAAAPGRLDRRELPLYGFLPRRRPCWLRPALLAAVLPYPAAALAHRRRGRRATPPAMALVAMGAAVALFFRQMILVYLV